MPKRVGLRVVVAASVLASAVLFSLVAPAQAAAPAGAWSDRGMVSASVAPAVPAGVEVLAAGGNAVDAAIATAFAGGVAHQFSSGIGGGGFIVGRLANGGGFVVDAREVAPGTIRPELYTQGTDRSSRSGGLSVAVPGLVQGLEELHQKYGSLPWARLLEPAIRLCREGVVIDVHHRKVLARALKRLTNYPETVSVQYKDGEVPPLGWKLIQPELARTLRAIARRGSKALTEGPIAEAMVQAAQEDGGVLSLQDLQGYRTVWREPVRGSYRGIEIVSMPPPSSGGVLLIEMLNALEGDDLVSLGHNSSRYIHRVSSVMKVAFADRPVYMGDPEFYPVPVKRLTSKAYAQDLRARLEPKLQHRLSPSRWRKPFIPRIKGPIEIPVDDAGTTHVSVMDEAGNAVAITQTVNTLFGSGITVPGTGIVLNNEMDDFAVMAGAPNLWGVSGSDANAVAPRKRPLSSMTPTILVKDGRNYAVLGSPMGPLIITTVLQTTLNLIDFGMDPQAAVSAPRFHHQWQPDKLRLEADHPADVVDTLKRWGHPAEIAPFEFGAAALVVHDPKTGLFWGASDPRRDSGAAGP